MYGNSWFVLNVQVVEKEVRSQFSVKDSSLDKPNPLFQNERNYRKLDVSLPRTTNLEVPWVLVPSV